MLIEKFNFKYEGEPDSLLGGTPAAEPVVEPAAEPAAEVDLITEGTWSGIPKELVDDPVMKAVPDVPTLVKNYVHAQRQMGKKGFILPTKNDDSDKWRELYTQLGGPALEEYKYETPEEVPLSQDFLSKFNQTAYENNILPHQAKAMVDFYLEEMAVEEENYQRESQEKLQESLNALKQEWGEGFEKKVKQAQAVVNTFGDESIRNYLNDSGLGNDPQLVKFFAKVGESLNEDSFQSEAVSHLGLTPDEAQENINKVMSDHSHPYHNEMHANHKNAVKEMTKWFEVVHGR